MATGWLRVEQADLAGDKILDAAATAFVELGVSRAGMGDIARYAGCSRGTLYRYFKSRDALDRAYVEREARRIAARIADELSEVKDPASRLLEGVMRSIQAVRGAPALAAWFAPEEAGLAAALSRSAEVVESVAGAFLEQTQSADDTAIRRRLEWLVRVVVSLLTLPGRSEEEERDLVARFVVPSVLAEAAGQG